MEKIIIAQFFIKPECVEIFKTLTVDLIKKTREESGNVFYQLYQSLENPTDFVFNETFKDQECFDFHLNTEHFKTFANALKDMEYKASVVKILI